MTEQNDPSDDAVQRLFRALPKDIREAVRLSGKNKRGQISSLTPLPETLFHDLGENTWQLNASVCAALFGKTTQIEAPIRALLEAKKYAAAAESFVDLGGMLLIFLIGPNRAQALINAFPEHIIENDKELRITAVVLAYKGGHFPRGEYLLRKYYGIEVFLLEDLLADKARWSLSEREAFLLIAIYRGLAFSETAESLILDILGEATSDNHFTRGRTYNCLLVEAMHTDRIDLARSYAYHAAHHYKEAKAPYLEFFVQFHLSTIFILDGEPSIAQAHIRRAQTLLAQTGFDTSSEARMLLLLQAILAFEAAETEPLNEFLRSDLQEMTAGEAWPQLATIAMTYAARAAFEQSGFPTAQALLANFRVNEWRSMRYDANLNRIEADLMQSSGRWMLARDVLRSLQNRTNALWVENASSDDMMRLRDPLEIDISLLWLRDECWHQPLRKSLLSRLQGLASNPYASPSQRLQCNVLVAYVWRKSGETTDAKRLLTSLLEKQGALLALAAVRVFIQEMMNKAEIRNYVAMSSTASETLSRLEMIARRSAKYILPQLTPQENRVLECVAEGASNKESARILDLSVATVKFHMTNILRKLEVRSRAEAAHIYRNRAKPAKT